VYKHPKEKEADFFVNEDMEESNLNTSQFPFKNSGYHNLSSLLFRVNRLSIEI
jgi:hypothetical protein